MANRVEYVPGPDVDETHWRIALAVLAGVVALLAFLGYLLLSPVTGGGSGGIGGGSVVTPSPYGPPDGNRTRAILTSPTPGVEKGEQ